MTESLMNPSVGQLQEIGDNIISYSDIMHGVAGYEALPKLHMAYHLVAHTRFQGSPKGYACWLGESANKLLKAHCRGVSQLTFETFLRTRM